MIGSSYGRCEDGVPEVPKRENYLVSEGPINIRGMKWRKTTNEFTVGETLRKGSTGRNFNVRDRLRRTPGRDEFKEGSQIVMECMIY